MISRVGINEETLGYTEKTKREDSALPRRDGCRVRAIHVLSDFLLWLQSLFVEKSKLRLICAVGAAAGWDFSCAFRRWRWRFTLSVAGSGNWYLV